MADYMAELMYGAVESGRIAGANVLVIKDGEEKYFGSYGKADMENGIDMRRDTVFRMFSMSKPVTATAVMILIERGVIDMLDPVERYLPGFKNPQVAVMDEPVVNGDARGCKYHLEPAARSVTIADLMTMTSGVCYPGIETAAHIAVDKCQQEWERKLRTYSFPGTVDFANALGACPLAFQPGTKWMYGFSADVLGAIVEVAAGRRFSDFLRDEIFTPLKMMSTGFDVTPGMRQRLAKAYENDWENGGRLREFKGMNLLLGDFPDRAILESGGAGLLSTIDDYARFAMMLANEGELDGVRLLGADTVRFMRSNALTEEINHRDMNWWSTLGHGYNCLMRILEEPAVQMTAAPAGEFGWDGWMGTYFTVEPESRSVIVYLKQLTNAGFDDITRRVRAVAYRMLSE